MFLLRKNKGSFDTPYSFGITYSKYKKNKKYTIAYIAIYIPSYVGEYISIISYDGNRFADKISVGMPGFIDAI